MKLKAIFLVSCILLMQSSCINQSYYVYVEKPTGVHTGIGGDHLNQFFESNGNSEIVSDQYRIDQVVEQELEMIKAELIMKSVNTTGSGIYEFAFIYKSDTIYSNFRLTSWLYKDKVGRVETSQAFRAKFSKYLKWWD